MSTPPHDDRSRSTALFARVFGPLPDFARGPEQRVRPTPARVAKALGIGLGGGALAAWLSLPLAWMLGAMIAVTAASFAGARLAIPAPLRTVMIAVLGVMLGSAFTPDILSQLPAWGGGVALLAGFIVLIATLGFGWFRHGAGTGRVTAYFAGMPGGLNEMALTGERMGGDLRVISLVHATRILLIVSVIPVYFRVVEGVEVPTLPPGGTSLSGIPPYEAALLTGCGLLGFALARAVRLPAAALVGPMILSALAHMSGLSALPPPNELIAIAQVVVGTAIGARFAGLTLRQVWPYLLVAAGSALLMMAAAVVVAMAFADLLGVSTAGLILALVPGGLAEMGLIALSLDIDTAFVSTMHILRISVVVTVAPTVFLLLARRRARAAGTPPPRSRS